MSNQGIPHPQRSFVETGVLDYTPPKTIREFMLSDKFAKFIIGPLGSAKSFGCIMHLFMNSIRQAPDAKGVRYTQHAIIRNTLPQLRTTCLPDILLLLGPLCEYKVTDQALFFDVQLDDDTRMVSKWMLLPLDDDASARRLLSLQLHSAWASEFRELPYGAISALLGRLGRHPSPAVARPNGYGLIAESNPFSEGSDWYKALELELPDIWGFWRQPGGMDPDAENLENLPGGREYYRRLIAMAAPEEWVKVHVHAQYGDDLSGQAVFGRAFRASYHLVPGLMPIPGLDLLIAQDFGRTPTALIAQPGHTGELRVLKELTAEGMGILEFVRSVLKPELAKPEWSGMTARMVFDPNGVHAGQVTEQSPAQVLQAEGFDARPAATNDLQPRLTAVEKLLLEQIGGRPMLQISREGCPLLHKALAHNYRYRRKKTGDIDNLPDKNHPWSDLADCLQYLCVSQSAGVSFAPKVNKVRELLKARGPISHTAWT